MAIEGVVLTGGICGVWMELSQAWLLFSGEMRF